MWDIFSEQYGKSQYLCFLRSDRIFLSVSEHGIFMTALVGMFGNTEYIRELIGGQNVLLFCCAFVGINAVCEMVASTVITGAVGTALSRARLIPASQIAVKQSI